MSLGFTRPDQRHDLFRDEDAVGAAEVFAQIELAQHPPVPRALDQAAGRNGLIGRGSSEPEGPTIHTGRPGYSF